MIKSETLSYSNDGLANRPLFLSDFNDINIYVEDLGKEYEYEEIFERLYDGIVKLFSVFPLGGKDEVLKRHSIESVCDANGKPNIFIVDGDFDNLWDDNKIDSQNLIYLTRYNIESFYVSKEATIKFMRTILKCTREEVENRVNFDQWFETQREDVGNLFILFAIARRYYPDLKSVNNASSKFIDKHGCTIKAKYDEYYTNLQSVVANLEEAIADIRTRISNRFIGDEKNKIFSIICGKYLYESLCRHLSTVANKNIPRDSFKSVVVSNFDISELYFIRDRIDALRIITDDTYTD